MIDEIRAIRRRLVEEARGDVRELARLCREAAIELSAAPTIREPESPARPATDARRTA